MRIAQKFIKEGEIAMEDNYNTETDIYM